MNDKTENKKQTEKIDRIIEFNIDKSGMGTVKLNGIALEKYVKGFTIKAEAGKPTECSLIIRGDMKGQVVADLLFPTIKKIEPEYKEPTHMNGFRIVPCTCVHIDKDEYNPDCPTHGKKVKEDRELKDKTHCSCTYIKIIGREDGGWNRVFERECPIHGDN